eukprot:1156837-Pelagomonas_calceolata.AAC.1
MMIQRKVTEKRRLPVRTVDWNDDTRVTREKRPQSRRLTASLFMNTGYRKKGRPLVKTVDC